MRCTIHTMKRIFRPPPSFFRRKNNVYQPYDAGRTSGRSCSSTWKMCVGPAYASQHTMACTTSADRSSTSPERVKLFVHVEDVRRTCVRIVAHDEVHHAPPPVILVFRPFEPLLTSARTAMRDGKKQCPERSRRHDDPRAHVICPTPSCTRHERDVSSQAGLRLSEEDHGSLPQSENCVPRCAR